MTDYVSEKGEGGGLSRLLRDKAGGGWLGYRGLIALILFTPQIGLFAYWITYIGVTLGTGMFYLTLIPFMIALPLTALLPRQKRDYAQNPRYSCYHGTYTLHYL